MQQPISPAGLRAEISARNRQRAEAFVHETTFGRTPHVVYAESAAGDHGNFLPAAYRRIVANHAWSRRLEKAYTSSARVPRSGDRRRAELECATSSDALLMNIFCYPGVLRRRTLCALLGIAPGTRPEFGVRAQLPMRHGEADRTELDLRLGDLLVEAKLTEGGFGTATRERLLRYVGVDDAFHIDALPWSTHGVAGYQIVRGALAAQNTEARFALLCDARRADLIELWLRVVSAVRSSELRSRMVLCTWQEIAATLPATVTKFLTEKYGLAPTGG